VLVVVTVVPYNVVVGGSITYVCVEVPYSVGFVTVVNVYEVTPAILVMRIRVEARVVLELTIVTAKVVEVDPVIVVMAAGSTASTPPRGPRLSAGTELAGGDGREEA
jgi:hypothetical protein